MKVSDQDAEKIGNYAIQNCIVSKYIAELFDEGEIMADEFSLLIKQNAFLSLSFVKEEIKEKDAVEYKELARKISNIQKITDDGFSRPISDYSKFHNEIADDIIEKYRVKLDKEPENSELETQINEYEEAEMKYRKKYVIDFSEIKNALDNFMESLKEKTEIPAEVIENTKKWKEKIRGWSAKEHVLYVHWANQGLLNGEKVKLFDGKEIEKGYFANKYTESMWLLGQKGDIDARNEIALKIGIAIIENPNNIDLVDTTIQEFITQESQDKLQQLANDQVQSTVEPTKSTDTRPDWLKNKRKNGR